MISFLSIASIKRVSAPLAIAKAAAGTGPSGPLAILKGAIGHR
jgi:hypothetical protein